MIKNFPDEYTALIIYLNAPSALNMVAVASPEKPATSYSYISSQWKPQISLIFVTFVMKCVIKLCAFVI
jgi:hypothetical protein